MRRLILGLAAATLLNIFTVTAYAQYDPGTDWKLQTENVTTYEACDSSMSAEQCMWSPMGGGNYKSCIADAAQNQTCQAKIVYSAFDTECINVWRNGACECDEQTHKLTGTCTYKRQQIP